MYSKQIIGCVLLDQKQLDLILEHIRPEMLDSQNARATLNTMIIMQTGGEPIDLVTVAMKFHTLRGENIGVFLTECMEATATVVYATHYAKQQYDYWSKNQLKNALSVVDFTAVSAQDVMAQIAQISSDFEGNFLERQKQSGDARQIITDYQKYIDGIKSGETKIIQCHSPGLYNDIYPERSIIPFWIGGLYVVISSYSSAGKSAMLANIAVREAEAGANVVIFSNEMGAFGYADRFAGYYSGIPYGHILFNKINGHQDYVIDEALGKFAKLPIKIFDKVRGVKEIKKTLKMLSYTQKTDIVLVDYLQNLVDKSDKVKNQTDIASQKLMEMAQVMDLSMVVASQVTNASGKDQVDDIFMDTKGSGDVSADCHIFITLKRNSLSNDEQTTRTIDMIIKKNRQFSHVGHKTIFFNKSFTRIENEYT